MSRFWHNVNGRIMISSLIELLDSGVTPFFVDPVFLTVCAYASRQRSCPRMTNNRIRSLTDKIYGNLYLAYPVDDRNSSVCSRG